jgi:hypothetical protein
MGIFDELSDKMKKKAQEKALEAAKDRFVEGVKQRVADAKEALFGDDDEEGTTRPEIPTKESEAEEAERLARKKARDEKRAALEARKKELEEAERKEAEALAKKRAEEAERRRLEHEKMVRDFEQKKSREKAEVDDELAALKKRLGKK